MYNNATGLASLVNSPYRDMDVMRVQMTPREVAGLQQLAMSYGANQDDLYDPITGEPRFSFLKKILPMVAGALLGGMGMSSFGAAATVGLGYGLIEGDLKKGLMAGLSAYSGSSIGAGLKAAAGAGQVSTEPPATLAAQLGLKESELISPFADSSKDLLGVSIPDTSAPIPAVSPVGASAAQAGTTVKPPQGLFGTMGRGASNIFTGQEGASDAFMKALGGPMGKC